MDRARLDNWCEKGILGLTLAILIFGPLATGAVRPVEWLVIESLLLGVLGLWVARFWINPGHRLLWPPVCWAVLAFVGYAIVRYRQADLEYVARGELIRILTYAFLFFAVLNNLHRQEATQLISFALVFLGMAISIYAIYQFATNSDRVWHFLRPAQYLKRGSGTYICPNHLAGFLVMLLPVGLAYTFLGRVSHVTKILLGYATCVILAGIGVSVSRGGWLAAGAALLLFCTLLLKRRQYRIPILLVVLVVGLAVNHFVANTRQVQQRVQNATALDTPETVRARIWLWQPAIAMWRDNFWWGVGPAHFDARFAQYRPREVQARPGWAHNDYLNTLADWGVAGTSLVALALGLLFAGVRKTWGFVQRDQNDLVAKSSNRAAFVFGASIGLVGILVHSCFDFNMQIPANAILAVTLMAMLSGHLRFASERYWVKSRLVIRVLATVIGLAGLVYLGQQGVRRADEHHQLARAGRAPADSPGRLAALAAAAAIEPTNFETAYALGESLRRLSWVGGDDYVERATEAMTWFERAIRLNPYSPTARIGLGMCLDWLDRHDEAGPHFEAAFRLDPNNYSVVAHRGWHFFQVEDYAQAKDCFVQSLNLMWASRNPIAIHYLEIIQRRRAEPAAPK